MTVLLRYLWAAPNTLLGLPLLLAALLCGARCALHCGVIEVHGGILRPLFRSGLCLGGGISAMTFGHLVIARDRFHLEISRAHELVHVRQYERWGPLFIPAYLLASLWAQLRGGNYYRDNYFEREARALSETNAADNHLAA